MKTTLKWVFPNSYFVRAETLALLLVSIVVFIFSLLQLADILVSLLATIIFATIYLAVSYVIQVVRAVEEKYHLKPPHLEIVRKSRYSTRKEKVNLRHVTYHKLDPLFLGGYLLTKKKKHLLFFNHVKELKKFERVLKKHVKS